MSWGLGRLGGLADQRSELEEAHNDDAHVQPTCDRECVLGQRDARKMTGGCSKHKLGVFSGWEGRGRYEQKRRRTSLRQCEQRGWPGWEGR